MISRLRIFSRSVPNIGRSVAVKPNGTLSGNTFVSIRSFSSENSPTASVNQSTTPKAASIGLSPGVAAVQEVDVNQLINPELETISSQEESKINYAELDEKSREEYEALITRKNVTSEEYLMTLGKIHSDFKLALQILYDMKSNNMNPCPEVYAKCLFVGRHTLSFREAIHIFAERDFEIMFTPSEEYSAVKQLYQIMKNEGYSLPVQFYENFVYELGRRYNGSWIREIIDFMRQNGIAPSVHIYNQQLKSYAHSNLYEFTFGLFEKLVRENLANTATHIIYMSSLSRFGEIDLLLKHYENHKSIFQESNSAYNVLIQAFLREHRIEEAKAIVAEMNQTENCKPCNTTHYCFLKHYLLGNNLAAAENVIYQLGPYSPSWHWSLKAVVLRVYSQLDKTKSVETLLALLNECKENWKLELANSLLTIFSDRRVPIGIKQALSEAIPEAEMPQRCYLTPYTENLPAYYRKTVMHLENGSNRPDSTTVSLIMAGLFDSQEFIKAKDLFRSMSEKKIRQSKKAFNYYLSSLLKLGDEKGAREVVAEMKRSRLEVSDINYKYMESLSSSPTPPNSPTYS